MPLGRTSGDSPDSEVPDRAPGGQGLSRLARPGSDPELRAALVRWMERAVAAGLDRDDIDALVTDVRDQHFQREITNG